MTIDAQILIITIDNRLNLLLNIKLGGYINILKITQSNKWFVVETKDGRLHVLSRKALIWNLKHVFNIKGNEGKAVMTQLDQTGQVDLSLKEAV